MGSYRERLLVPVSYWLLTVPVVVTLGAESRSMTRANSTVLGSAAKMLAATSTM